MRLFSGANRIDQELFKDTKMDYQGEVAFFAVNSKYRGIGLGKKLFQAVKDYMRSQKIQNFFLYTDTSCNYPFYEHQGMKRRSTRAYILDKTETLTMFLYDYDMKGKASENRTA